MAGEAEAVGPFRFLKNPRLCPQSTDIQAAVAWSVAATTTTAFWLIQPIDWFKKTYLRKPEPEEMRTQI